MSGADSYRLYRSDTQDGTYAEIESDITVTSTDDYSIMPGATYWYKVAAYSAAYSVESDPSSAGSGFNSGVPL